MVFFCGQLFFLALVVFWVGGPNCRVFDLASHLRIFVKRCGLAIWVGANGTKPRRLDARYWLSGSRWRWGGAAAGGAGGGGGAQYAYPMLAAAARRPGAPISHSRKAGCEILAQWEGEKCGTLIDGDGWMRDIGSVGG